jgi:hypothetical protein
VNTAHDARSVDDGGAARRALRGVLTPHTICSSLEVECYAFLMLILAPPTVRTVDPMAEPRLDDTDNNNNNNQNNNNHNNSNNTNNSNDQVANGQMSRADAMGGIAAPVVAPLFRFSDSHAARKRARFHCFLIVQP